MRGAGDDAVLGEDQGGEAGGRGAEGRVHDGRGDGHAVAGVGDAALKRLREREGVIFISDCLKIDPVARAS